MDDFGMLARDFGFRPQGKSAPMKSNVGSDAGDRRNRSSPLYDADHDSNRDGLLFNDVFGGPPKYSNNSNSDSNSNSNSKPSPMSEYDYDSIFKSSGGTNDAKSKSVSSSTLPDYDKPVYDDDIFEGLPGLKSKSMSSSAKSEENVFASTASPWQDRNDHFDDLFGNLGRTEKAEPKKNNDNNSKSSRDLDDLLPGFGSDSPASSNRLIPEPVQSSKSTSNSNQTASTMMDDPFVVLESTSTPGVSSSGMFTDPLEEFSKLTRPRSTKVDHSSASGGVFDDINPLNGFGKTAIPSDMNNRGKDGSPSRSRSNLGGMQTSAGGEHAGKSTSRYSDNFSEKKVHVDNFQESHQTMFDVPTSSMDSQKSFGETATSPPYANASFSQTSSQAGMSSSAEEQMQSIDDIWITVSEIPLFTQPTNAPPPSRPPPPIPRYRGSFASNVRKKGDEFFSPSSYTQYSKGPRPTHPAAKGPPVSSIDELEDFAMGRSQKNVVESDDINFTEENSTAAASAAAMKEAMDRAEAKFKQAKEVREREFAKAARSKDAGQQEKDDQEIQEREYRENQERLDREHRQREEEEREQKRVEKERERDRERARQAVERATREARERAAAEARERAAREKALAAERAAVEKVQSEARERAERAAVQRAQAEARERAAAEARERAEKAAAAAAQEKANLEAREKEVREKVEKAAAEARRRAERAAVERAAAEARERAAAAAKMNQQKNEDDLESFFSMGSRPSSAPRPRASSSDPLDPQSQGRVGTEGQRRTSSSGTSSNIRKASSTTNIVDDLTSIFGAAASSGEFQEVEGETEERRKARLERHLRTQERAAKALAEKNHRDLQTQREQEERHSFAETLDIEIKRWATGKEGNLRALLSTLQYVLWPECGWQPVSLTDLIMGPSVKKVYRKATLCIHPDKVQQKGATLQQKYIAEKVFDLLKEAWNKFNSEELF